MDELQTTPIPEPYRDHDAGTTVKRLESQLLSLMRQKFQKYAEEILQLLKVELEIKGDSEIVDYLIPGSTIKLTFNPQNEGYGLQVFDGRDFIFASPSEMSLESGSTIPLEEGMLQMSDTQIRVSLELFKSASEALHAHIAKKRQEFQEKLDLVSKY